jgi:hypothetical protein
MTDTRTDEELKARIKLLEDEMDANEEENRQMQEELETLYDEQDRRSEA